MRKPTRVPILCILSILLLLAGDPAGASPGALREGDTFTGRALRFDLPPDFQALEAVDGSCFVYHESTTGFLVLYRASAPPDETLSTLLAATAGVRRTERPLQVDVAGRTFSGLFVETAGGDRLFLAAAGGWGLVAQGAVAGWPSLAAGLNGVLRSLAFVEER